MSFQVGLVIGKKKCSAWILSHQRHWDGTSTYTVYSGFRWLLIIKDIKIVAVVQEHEIGPLNFYINYPYSIWLIFLEEQGNVRISATDMLLNENLPDSITKHKIHSTSIFSVSFLPYCYRQMVEMVNWPYQSVIKLGIASMAWNEKLKIACTVLSSPLMTIFLALVETFPDTVIEDRCKFQTFAYSTSSIAPLHF